MERTFTSTRHASSTGIATLRTRLIAPLSLERILSSVFQLELLASLNRSIGERDKARLGPSLAGDVKIGDDCFIGAGVTIL